MTHFQKCLVLLGAQAVSAAPQWLQVGTDIDGSVAFYGLGSALSLSADGTRIAVGASIANGSQGASSIFELQSDSWVQLGNAIDGEAASDKSGSAIALSADGNGAPQNDDAGDNAGHARVYLNTKVDLGFKLALISTEKLPGTRVALQCQCLPMARESLLEPPITAVQAILVYLNFKAVHGFRSVQILMETKPTPVVPWLFHYLLVVLA